jgi:regulator of protease activity HflC (stomatin/prohibitin superfamily)
MKNLCLVVLAVIAIFGLAGCTVATPDAGHEVVWVEKPWLMGHGGIDPSPVKTGREYGAPSSDAIDVDMLPQRVDLEFDDMMTKSGVPVSFHVVATFRIIDSVKLVSQFGADRDDKGKWGFWDRNLDQPLRTAVRDSVKKREMQEMAISQTAADDVGKEVVDAADKLVKDFWFTHRHHGAECRSRKSAGCYQESADRDCRAGATSDHRTTDKTCGRSTQRSGAQPCFR